MRRHSLLFGLLALSLAGCNAGDDSQAATGDEEIVDVRVTVPEPSAEYIDFVTEEKVIAPGEEKLFCFHFRYDGPDVAFDEQESLQGKFGHHTTLVTPKEPKAPGTVEDCSSAESMDAYNAFTVPGNRLPAGYGTFLKGGTALVMQNHYINTGMKPIKVRDVARLHTIPLESVTTWASVYIMVTRNLEIPAHGTGTRSIECTMDQDVDLLLVAGHMHEWGKKVSMVAGPTKETAEPVYVTDDWRPEYRDVPPATLFFDNPMHIPQGTYLRTDCEWFNNTSEVIGFPKEMCVSFGFVAGPKEPVECQK
jgi:hypothetical protein